MPKHNRQTAGFPRIDCVIKGCRRGTTRIEPHAPGILDLETGNHAQEWICPVHWRLVPKSWKRRRALFIRAFRRDRDRDNRPDMWISVARCERMWAQIKRYLEDPSEFTAEGGLPPGLQEQLERLKLL